jgi:integrase
MRSRREQKDSTAVPSTEAEFKTYWESKGRTAYNDRMEAEFRQGLSVIDANGQANNGPATEAERQLWEQIDNRIKALAGQSDSASFNCEQELPAGAIDAGLVGEERSDSTAPQPDPAPAFVSTEGPPTRLLEPERKSVDRKPQRKGEYELRACRCRSRFCPHCSLTEGLATKQRVLRAVKTFKALLMWTFTVDPKLFALPVIAYRHVQSERCIGEWVRSMWKAGYLHSRRYFCVVEWQMGKGEKAGTLMAHYHVLLDADFIPVERGQQRWDLFRPDTAGPVEAGRPGFGWAFVTKVKFASPEHAAHYACKYLLKQPEKGFPDWVLDSRGEIKRYWPSKGFYKVEGVEPEIVEAVEVTDDDVETELESETATELQSTIRERIGRCGKPRRPSDISTAAVAVLVAELRDIRKLRTATISGLLSHLRAAIRWGHQRGLVPLLPQFSMPRTPKGTARMRGRPITEEEFDRLLDAAAKYRPHDANAWLFFLRGLWLSGLRLGEALQLSWERDAGLAVEVRDGRTFLRIKAESEKGFKDRFIPTTPDFGALLLEVVETERRGRVFRLDGLLTREPITPKRVSRIISAIGRKAGVVVNKEQGKFGSAHDLRRAYGTRWAKRLKPFALKTLMRHESIETTEHYYIDLKAEELADELWKGSTSNMATELIAKGHSISPMNR